MKEIHVVPDHGEWLVLVDGQDRPVSLFNSRSEAIAAGKALAQKQRGEITVYGEDGRIRSWNSFAGDSQAVTEPRARD